jgi:hypothetical protein
MADLDAWCARCAVVSVTFVRDASRKIAGSRREGDLRSPQTLAIDDLRNNSGMQMDEFERRHGMRYSTIIFVPHQRAKFRKLRISHRLMFSIISLVASSFCLSLLFSVTYFTRLRDDQLVRSASTKALERDLAAANRQVAAANAEMAQRLRDVDVLMQQLLREQRSRERQLADLRTQYESLKVLTAGQERIAEAHRAILQRRTLWDRAIEVGLGFSLGVLSSLVASLLWVWLRSKPISGEEVAELEKE